jgi:hypothetical protein
MAGRKTLPSLAYFRHTSNFNPFNDPAMGEEEGGGGLTKKKKKNSSESNQSWCIQIRQIH